MFKVFPLGVCSFDGYFFGCPLLDVPPYGLGHRMALNCHTFTALNLNLPRCELARRDMYRAEVNWIDEAFGDGPRSIDHAFHLMNELTQGS